VEATNKLSLPALYVHTPYTFCLALTALVDAWIITLSILSLVIIYPYGNLKAIDAYFFGASASTESGLNT
jgi:hypothetical protein